MDGSSHHYCLRWNNHRSNLLTVFDELLRNEEFTDVTLAVDGGSVKCHKVVLIACSSYFQKLFYDFPCKHPIVILKDVKYFEIKAILEYMYRGEVKIAQEQLGGLLKVAGVLKVKGLIEEHGSGAKTSDHQQQEAEPSTSPQPAISTSTGNAPHSSVNPPSSPHSTGAACNLYGKCGSVDRDMRVAMPMWRLPLHHVASSHQSTSSHAATFAGGTYDNGCESPPLKRKKMLLQAPVSLAAGRHDMPILRNVLGQGYADSSQTAISLVHPDNHESQFRSSSNGSANDDNRGNVDMSSQGEAVNNSPYVEVGMMDEEDRQQSSPQAYTGDNSSAVTNYAPIQKPEWKRYKQYTREDIMAAIEAVKSGMSAVKAARQYGVPSRTLYDKVKKLGITTSRPFKRASNGSSACFPYVSSNINGTVYGAMSESETENSNANVTESSAAVIPHETARAKDMSQDRGDSAIVYLTRSSPSPVIRSAAKQQQQEITANDDEVEDLSVSRKSDVPMIIPSNTSDDIKEEEAQDPGSADCCDYN